MTLKVIRPGTGDEWIEAEVNAEYKVPDLQPDDVVLDLGANIGAFSILAWNKGSRNIWGYECDADNYAIACLNTKDYPGIKMDNRAVVRSDKPSTKAYFSGYGTDPEGRVIPGGGNVIMRQDGTINDGSRPGDIWVPTMPLDSILERFDSVRFLKIDIEGSEWPVLATSKRLHQVQEITGEYHINAPYINESFGLEGVTFDGPGLRKILEDAGFTDIFIQREAETGPLPAPHIGYFTAKRT